MMRTYRAYLLAFCLLFQMGVSAQEAPAPITDDTIDASQIKSEVEVPVSTPEPIPPPAEKKPKKKGKKKKTPAAEEQASSNFKHFSALELGSAIVGTASVSGGHDVQLEDIKTFTLGFITKTSFLMGLIEVPFLEANIRIHYEPNSGQTDYNYVGDSGIRYTKTAAPFELTSYKVDLGYRLTPLYSKRFQPFIEFGANLGYNSLKFRDAIISDLALQGNDYLLNQDFASYGYYGKWGGVFYVSQHIGLYFDYGVTYQTGFTTRLFGKLLISKVQNMSFGLSYGF